MVRFARLFKTGVICCALTLALTLPAYALHLPDLKAGFDYNIRQSRISPSLTIELYDRSRWCFDFGLTADVLYFSLGWNIVPIVEIAPHLFFGYNVHESTWTWGIGITWVKW